jgi:hypothetical protein
MMPPRDPKNTAAEGVYAALLRARRSAGDAALAEAFEKLGEASGENKFRYAGKIVRGVVAGRKEIDDRVPLRRIETWPADRRSAAVGKVARDLAGPEANDRKIARIERRLRRKLKKKNGQNGSIRQSASI